MPIDKLYKHRDLLKKWRKAMDLIGPGDMETHFQDSIGAVADLKISGEWIDLGSGAGFPGIALATYHPEISVLLVESREKRVFFLDRVIKESRLQNVNIYHGRTESIDHQFDGVISRAYKPPLAYLKDAYQLCKSSGKAICLLGEDGHFEIPQEWTFEQENRYSVGDGLRKRWILSKSLPIPK